MLARLIIKTLRVLQKLKLLPIKRSTTLGGAFALYIIKSFASPLRSIKRSTGAFNPCQPFTKLLRCRGTCRCSSVVAS
ncbi:hypothetical protein HBZC1_18130 [Helicobacter bizzozeronii CIII-1]|uniref:Uncharacterized protein n=1 Tax=Helicobacter bizzozeronii (strain CIII-1) TaxID=1002804 RepID=F8KQH6_HELBC|nr:hypothetical protein HBZC1_18130 [Helicobacter bizzozeronii CIII-1]